MEIIKILKKIEIPAMVIAIASAIWTSVAMSKSVDPASDPQLQLPIMITVLTTSIFFVALVAREAKEFGWVQAAVSIVTLIIVQVVLFFLFR